MEPDSRTPLVNADVLEVGSDQTNIKAYQSLLPNSPLESSQNDSGNPPDNQPPMARTYSVTRARWVSLVGFLLYTMTAFPSASLSQQYLMHRWSREAGLVIFSNESVCFRNDSDPRQRLEDDVQARVSTSMSYFGIAFNVPAVFVCVLLGTYSDVIGRRKTFLIPLGSGVIKFVICVFFVKYDLSIAFIYLALVIDGLGGTYYAVYIASYSIAADLSTQKSWRLLYMSIIGGSSDAVTAGFTILVGYFIDHYGFFAATVLTTIPMGLAFFLVLFFLPETVPKLEGGNLNVLSNVGRMVKLYTSHGSRRRRICMLICLGLFFLSIMDIVNLSSIDTLYQMHHPLCWGATKIAYYSGASHGIASVAGIGFQWIFQRLGCLADEMAAMIGMLFQVGAFILEAFATTDLMMFMVPVVYFPSFPVNGIIKGVMSILAGPYTQGTLFAGISVCQVLCSLITTTTFYQIYSATVHTMPGAVYLLMAAIAFLDFLLFLVFLYFYNDPSLQSSIKRELMDKKQQVKVKR